LDSDSTEFHGELFMSGEHNPPAIAELLKRHRSEHEIEDTLVAVREALDDIYTRVERVVRNGQ